MIDSAKYSSYFFLAVGGLFFYFFLWRPEKKRRMRIDALKGAVKPGDRVNVGGVLGVVDEVRDDTLIVIMFDGSSKIEVVKGLLSEMGATVTAATNIRASTKEPV